MLKTLGPCVLAGLLCSPPPAAAAAPAPEAETEPAPEPAIEHLAAFARLYGYVRFFYPGDEASRVDWDRFAILGSRRIAEVGDRGRLRPALERLFAPLVPTLRIYPDSEEPPPLPAADREGPDREGPDREGKVPVFWQHVGLGLDDRPGNVYESVRVYRPDDPLEPTNRVVQTIVGEDHEGRRFRLSAQVRARVAGGTSGGRLLVRVVDENLVTSVDEDLRDRLATENAWREVEIEGTFTGSTDYLAFGVGLAGTGEACFDDVRFEVADAEGAWTPLEVANAGFEGAVDGVPEGWDFAGPGYVFTASGDEPFAGLRSGCLASREGYVPGSLFLARPDPSEVVDEPLGAGLKVRFPLVLRLDPQPPTDAPAETSETLAGLLAELSAIDLDAASADDPAVRIAGVSIAWNVWQHSYPYFDVVAVDWRHALLDALADSVADRTARDFLLTLRRLTAKLEDGHGFVFHPEMNDLVLDLELGWIEERLVVLDPRRATELEVLDVIETVDEVPAREELEKWAATFSGTPRWRRRVALTRLAPGPAETPVRLGVRRGDEHLTVEAPRAAPRPPQVGGDDGPEVRRLAEGVWYVDLRRASWEEIEGRIDELASARGVVFDLRGYPRGNHQVLSHLTDVPLRSAKWNVPRILYPDRERIAGWETGGRWTLEPAAPRFAGRAVFLTDARAISYAESVLGIVEHYRLGDIVGGPTAGANGNVNSVTLPGGFRVGWTGMKVVKHDDSQHHLVGIRPTDRAEPTLAGVRAGRDEVLERALDLIGE